MNCRIQTVSRRQGNPGRAMRNSVQLAQALLLYLGRSPTQMARSQAVVSTSRAGHTLQNGTHLGVIGCQTRLRLPQGGNQGTHEITKDTEAVAEPPSQMAADRFRQR